MKNREAKMQFLTSVGNAFLQKKEHPHFKNIPFCCDLKFLKRGCGVFVDKFLVKN